MSGCEITNRHARIRKKKLLFSCEFKYVKEIKNRVCGNQMIPLVRFCGRQVPLKDRNILRMQ